MNFPIPEDEAERLKALESYSLIEADREAAFDNIATLASAIFGVPIALVSTVGREAQCFRGVRGLEAAGSSRDTAFCAFAILNSDIMVVEDATQDARFRDNPLVTGEPHIRFYAGAPLRVGNGDGHAVGTLCLIDTRPRRLAPAEREKLVLLARTAVDLIEMRRDRFRADEERARAFHERELLKLTVENVREAVALVDGRFRLILWNQAFLELFGYEKSQIFEGADAAALMRVTAERGELGDGDPHEVVARLVQSITSTESRRIEIQRRDGRVLDIWRCSIAGGRFIMAARDVTDERQAARLKDELVSTVSHELRTPLTAISGALGLVDSGAAGSLPPRAQSLVAVALRNCDRLRRLVDDLLDLDKLRSGQMAMRFAEADLGALLRETLEQNLPFAVRHSVSLRLNAPPDPVMVRVDPDRIGQVVTNLLSNAVKFSPEGGEVRIQLTSGNGWANIRVADQGPGVSEQFKDRLFSRFAQEDTSDHRRGTGTGLGLAISKNIVDLHNGRIELEPSSGTGATFLVSLPLAREA